MPEKLSAKEAAIQLGTNARTLRKFLRSKSSPMTPVGQGNRYEFTTKDIKSLKKSFLAWSSGAPTKAKTTEKPIPKEILDDISDALDEVNDPTTDENGYTDQDYADHQGVDLDDLGEITEEDLDEDEDELDRLEGPDDEELIDIEDGLEEEDLEIE